MNDKKILAVLVDENSVTHEVTKRNLRAYKGRLAKCECGEIISIDDPPIICNSCSAVPQTLISSAHEWWNQPALESANVLLIGCGAIGNEVAKNLALMGVGNMTIVDFDSIEEHNLSRTVLFNSLTMEKAKSPYKVDVMKEGLLSLNPDMNIVTKCTGVLDSISKRKGSYLWWKDEALNDEMLIELSTNHDMCVIATDGVAPKAYIARILYPLIPIVQAAMNSTGSVAKVRTSLPLITGCIMCPKEDDFVELDEQGHPSKYYQRLQQQTGAGGCQIFAEAMGAASFTDSNAVVGSLATSQCVSILMGWKKFVSGGFKSWPKGVPLPLWNEEHLVYPRNPGSSHNIKLLNMLDFYGDFVCVECSGLIQRVSKTFETLKRIGGDPVFPSIYESLRYLNPEGVERPSRKKKLGEM